MLDRLKGLLKIAVVAVAGAGLLDVPHAIYYEHPEWLLRGFFRKELCQPA